MIAPIMKMRNAGEEIDIKECVDLNTLTVVEFYKDENKTREYCYDEISNFYDKETKILRLPNRESDFMYYLIKYDADRPNTIKFTSNKKFPTHLKYRAMCTFDISKDGGITLIDIEDGGEIIV